MNQAFETRVVGPACALAVALTIAAVPSTAQVHKCKTSDGQIVYQQAPCEKTGTTGGKLELQDAPATGKSSGKIRSTDGTNQQTMNEAFHRRMEQKDYEGALAFATTDKQKAQARQKMTDKSSKCSSLSIKRQKAQAELQSKGARYKAAADAAEAEYNLSCR